MKLITLTLVLTGMLWVTVLQTQMIVPIQLTEQKNIISLKLKKMGASSEKLPAAFELASKQTGLSTDFLMALIQTESNFNERAISSKGYKGLAQIPHAVYYPDANILIGAHIFNEKMRIANGNVVKAICLYKGFEYDSRRGKDKAKSVLDLYSKLRKMEV
jgi:soluble lytic murein transglycosylase-like protein